MMKYCVLISTTAAFLALTTLPAYGVSPEPGPPIHESPPAGKFRSRIAAWKQRVAHQMEFRALRSPTATSLIATLGSSNKWKYAAKMAKTVNGEFRDLRNQLWGETLMFHRNTVRALNVVSASGSCLLLPGLVHQLHPLIPTAFVGAAIIIAAFTEVVIPTMMAPKTEKSKRKVLKQTARNVLLFDRDKPGASDYADSLNQIAESLAR